MILQVHSYTVFDIASESQSRAGGYHFLGNKNLIQCNTPILVIAKIIQGVMASAAEAEVGSLFINAQEAIPICQCLENLGHPQPPTPITTDNTTARGFIRGTMKQRQSKVYHRRFNWIKDQHE